MSYEHANMPLAGDILDDFATIFREMFSKVSVTSANKCVNVRLYEAQRVKRDACCQCASLSMKKMCECLNSRHI